MAMQAGQVREWLSQFGDAHLVAIDDGGLCLVDNDDEEDCIEVGGVRGCPGCTGENEPDTYDARDNADTPGGDVCPVCGTTDAADRLRQ